MWGRTRNACWIVVATVALFATSATQAAKTPDWLRDAVNPKLR